MPINVYECLKCGERVGLDGSTFDSTVEPKCPNCSDGTLKLIYSLNFMEFSGEPATNCST